MNSPPTWAKAAPLTPPAAMTPVIRAMPTGSFAPASPSKMVPLRPEISRCPSTENTTAGSVGATAVATSSATNQVRLKARCTKTAPAATVRKVPATPTTAMGAAADLNRDQPMCIPPSNRMHTRATVTTLSAACSGGACRAGMTLTATAAKTRNSAGEGILTQVVRWLDSTATSPTPAARENEQSKRLSLGHMGKLPVWACQLALPTRLPGSPLVTLASQQISQSGRSPHATQYPGGPAVSPRPAVGIEKLGLPTPATRWGTSEGPPCGGSGHLRHPHPPPGQFVQVDEDRELGSAGSHRHVAVEHLAE